MRKHGFGSAVKDERQLLAYGIEVSGLSARKFAKLIGVDERTVRYWLADERGIPGPVRMLCALLVADPTIVVDPEGAAEWASVSEVMQELRAALDASK
jgi:hypothetical protein